MNTTVLIFVIVAVGVLYGQDTSVNRSTVNICEGLDQYQRVPDHADCTRFYVCPPSPRPPEHHTCIGDDRFDVVTELCTRADLATCFNSVIRRPVNICTGFEANQRIPDYTDCEQFYECDNLGTPTRYSCSTGFRFDVVSELCINAGLVTCFTCPANQYFVDLPMDRNCNQFVRCFAGHPSQRPCSDGLLFDPFHQQCNFAENVTCSCPLRDIPSRPVFFQSPDNCAQYRVCANGTEIHRECPTGLHFNMELHQCDFPNSNCTDTLRLE